MIHYADPAAGVTPDNLHGFFVGWSNPPSATIHLKLLEASDHVILATEEETGDVVGYVTAMSDGVLGANISLLEVLPAYRERGIGTELFRRVLEKLDGLYMVDLTCDPELQPFYERFGICPASAMVLRRYEKQSRR